MHIRHPLLRPEAVEFRGYQANIARLAAKHDTLVVLPTGLGKTVVALLVIADALQAGATRVLVMAPTKPLVEQHAAFLAEALAAPWGEQVQALTGHVPPDKRAARYQEPGVLCATPQVISNDVVAGHLDLGSMDLVVFDEAHRAVGDYPYAFLGRQAQRHDTRRLGLTASPGHEVRKIDEVRQNLGLHHVEVRTPQDPDVEEYVQETTVEWETLPLPANLARISKRLQEALAERVRELKRHGFLKTGGSRPNRRTLLEVAHKLQAMARDRADVPAEVYQGLSLQAQTMKLLHAIELAETQGAAPFRAFVAKLREEAAGAKPSKATLRILDDPRVIEADHIARFDEQENPKLGRTTVLVREALDNDPDSRVIVFANYRDTVDSLAKILADIPGVRPVTFVGQGKRKGRDGLSQKQQAEVLDAFRAGTHNCLVATSVAEEGLDIPATDLVVFYEPIPSEIRSIQRRGRTGRHGAGRVVVLMTKGTQDEAAHWTARRKEQQMVEELQHLRSHFRRAESTPTHAAGAQATLEEVELRSSRVPGPADDAPRSAEAGRSGRTAQAAQAAQGAEAGLERRPRITCDHREQAGGVVRHLHELGTEVELRPLDVGDFVLSDRVVVERKQGADFVDSLVDGRLFDQLKALQVYPTAILVIEGGGLLGHRNVAPESLYGALSAIAADLGIAVLQTRDPLETARFLHATAKREQFRSGRGLALRPGKTAKSDVERLRFILAGFPHVDEARADALLAHFGSLAAVFQADEAALAEVDGIGPTIAKDVRRILDRSYDGT